jgi:hypothetical protein
MTRAGLNSSLVGVVLLVAASGGSAKNAPAEPGSSVVRPEGVAPTPGEIARATTETLWIFDADFQDTLGDNAGWRSLDKSRNSSCPNYWHVDTIRTPLSRPYLGDYTWWCGTYSPCWRQHRGYGNDWTCILERAFPEVDANTNPGDQLQLSWDQRYAAERNYDYCYVDISTDDGVTWVTKKSYTNPGFQGAGVPTNWGGTNGHVVMDAHVYAGVPNLKLRFRFESDASYSAADQHDNSLHSVKDGAWQLDNITWSKGDLPVQFWLDNCETGGDPGWVHDSFTGSGQTGVTFFRGRYGIDFSTGRPPTGDEPPVGTWMYGAVDTATGTMVDGEYTCLLSPPIDIAGSDSVVVQWSGWVDCPEAAYDILQRSVPVSDAIECVWPLGGLAAPDWLSWSGTGPAWLTTTEACTPSTGRNWLASRWHLMNTESPHPGAVHMAGLFLTRMRVGVKVATAVDGGEWGGDVALTVRPVPFRESTTIRYVMPSAGAVTIRVFDLAGRLVRTLVDARVCVGEHEAVWDGTTDVGERAASGVYFVRMDAEGFRGEQKLVLLR